MCDMADAAGTQTRTTAHGLIDDLREARQVELAVFTDLAGTLHPKKGRGVIYETQ